MATGRVVNTVELLELILLCLPLNELLRMRQVSTTWRDLIMQTTMIRNIGDKSYIAVQIQLPPICSVSEGQPPILEVA
jgi:hypothetical protein